MPPGVVDQWSYEWAGPRCLAIFRNCRPAGAAEIYSCIATPLRVRCVDLPQGRGRAPGTDAEGHSGGCRRAPDKFHFSRWGLRLTLHIHFVGSLPGGMQKGTWPHPGVPCPVVRTCRFAQGSLGCVGGGAGPVRHGRVGLGLSRASGVRLRLRGGVRGRRVRRRSPSPGLARKLKAAPQRRKPGPVFGIPTVSLSEGRFL